MSSAGGGGDETPREDSFQVTLPSNACTDIYPLNKANSFTIKFMRPLHCLSPSDWEFALMDIQIPLNWPNILQSSKVFLFAEYRREKEAAASVSSVKAGLSPEKGATGPLRDIDGQPEWAIVGIDMPASDQPVEKPAAEAPAPEVGTPAPLKEQNFSNAATKEDMESVTEALKLDDYFRIWPFNFAVEVPKGHYHSVPKLAQYIQKKIQAGLQTVSSKIKKENLGIDIEYDPITGYISFTGKGPFVYHLATFDSYLLEGVFHLSKTHTSRSVHTDRPLTKPALNFYRLPQVGARAAELEQLSSVYVYSDIAQHQLIGGTTAQLLAIVPIQTPEGEERARGQQQFFITNPPYYMPVPKAEMDSVHIQLNTDWGDPFPFEESGNSKVRCRLHFRKRNPVTRQLYI